MAQPAWIACNYSLRRSAPCEPRGGARPRPLLSQSLRGLSIRCARRARAQCQAVSPVAVPARSVNWLRWYHRPNGISLAPLAQVRVSLSPQTYPLLRLLADGEVHSGRALAATLGVSRADLRRRVRAVAQLGLPLLGMRGRGYRLAEPLDFLDGERLARLLQPAFSVEILDACPSTNGVLMERARGGAREGLVLACEHQTAGRGRRGKRWESGIGTDLTFSVLWRFEQGAGALSGLSLAVGVALVRALDRLGHPGVQLKWPNDLILRGCKLGGILVEVSGHHTGPSAVVVGIGLNVRWSAARSAALDQPATGLSEANAIVAPRTILLAGLIVELHASLDLFARAGFGPFRAEWLRHHAWQGRRVTLCVAQRTVADGEAVGIGEDGALLVRSARGVERFHSGELRLAS